MLRRVSLALLCAFLSIFIVQCGGQTPQVVEVQPTAAPEPTAVPQATAAPAAEATTAPAAEDTSARRVRTIVMLSNVQAQDPQEFESTRLIVEEMKKLGLDVEHRAIPWEQQSDLVWFNRDKWDVTAWRMVGRSERMDPDEFIYNLFHSSTAEKGYNFIGYNNPEYDKIAEAQRAETDPAARKELVIDAQQMLAEDQPYGFLVNPRVSFVFNNNIWDESSIVDAKGIGIKNFWTFVEATPKGDQKDMVLNGMTQVRAINPLYISGGVDSWVTELVWDRLMRINAEGLPEPWAAEKVEWVDDTTIDVTLREGMTWHDGEPVTVDDVVFSFQAPAGDAAPMYKPFVGRIAGVEAQDGNVVRFTLSSPYAAFETAALAKINLIPKHIWEPILTDLAAKGQNAETYQEENPIGSGPFRFVNWKPGEEIVLEAFDEHFAAPKMERWILRQTANTEAVLGQITSGELNFLTDYTGDNSVLEELVGANPQLSMITTTEVGMRFVAYNHRRPPFDDAAFRRAVSGVINQDTIVTQIYKGFAVPADSPISKALDFWRPTTIENAPAFNVEQARALLEEAGYEWDAEGHLLYPEGMTETTTPAE